MRNVMTIVILTIVLSLGVQAQDDDSASHWWNEQVFYEIFVRSFYDSDGDGIGDLQGIIERLDYLNDGDPSTTDDLGVTGMWLMPIMESPSYHGYDVTNYYKVNPDYGTNEDFKNLVDAAHERGMVVIVDLVLNHTSSKHPYFVDSMVGHSHEDWYIWQDVRPESVQTLKGQTVWHGGGGRYYYGAFSSHQPDLNYTNPDVTEEMYNVSRFWLEEMGADGFRLDAIKHLIEDGNVLENSDATLEWFDAYHNFISEVESDALLVGEVWSSREEMLLYVGDKVDIVFEFSLATAILDSVNGRRSDEIEAAFESILAAYPPGQYATFIANHDQNRVMSQLGKNLPKSQIAASILLTTPGVPFIYYGEEIGMQGAKPDERIRTPMQWDDTPDTAGFTSGKPWQALAKDYETSNVAVMNGDEQSLLNHYRSLIQLRHKQPALRTGNMVLVESENTKIFSFIRQNVDDTLLVIINMDRFEITDYALTLPEGISLNGAELLFGGNAETLAPRGTYILKLR